MTHGQDCEIDVNCVFEGNVTLGDNVRIGAHCVIRNVNIASNARIHEFTHIDGEKAGASVGEGALIGPFARLRPGAQLGPEVHIGNFVEVKNSTLAAGAKANHLAYLGDATVGERVNYGAGSITANYDGANKHRTEIGDDVHVGSNCVLVALVTIGGCHHRWWLDHHQSPSARASWRWRVASRWRSAGGRGPPKSAEHPAPSASTPSPTRAPVFT